MHHNALPSISARRSLSRRCLQGGYRSNFAGTVSLVDGTTEHPYFADVAEIWDQVSESQRAVVEQVRSVLSELALPFARPSDTRTTYDPSRESVALSIRHGTGSTVL